MAPSAWGTTGGKECRGRRKKSARVGLWTRREAEKSKNRLSRLAWKSRKHRGIPTFPQPRRRLAINLNRTFHLLLKPDILICYQHMPRWRETSSSCTRRADGGRGLDNILRGIVVVTSP